MINIYINIYIFIYIYIYKIYIYIFTCSTIWSKASGEPPPIPKHRRISTNILMRKGGAKHNLLSHGDCAFIAYMKYL